MKDSSIMIGIVFVVVMFLALWFSAEPYVPYYEDTLFPKQFPYEGFEQISPLEYSNVSNHTALDDVYLLRSITPQNVDCKKVGGFTGCGVFCNPSGVEQKIDIYSNSQASLECSGTSSGLSNSKGSICLTDIQKRQLQTRGGNASGGESQIGNK